MGAARCLRHVGLDLLKLATIKAEHDELMEEVLGLEEEKHKFEEYYDLLAGRRLWWRTKGQDLMERWSAYLDKW